MTRPFLRVSTGLLSDSLLYSPGTAQGYTITTCGFHSFLIHEFCLKKLTQHMSQYYEWVDKLSHCVYC